MKAASTGWGPNLFGIYGATAGKTGFKTYKALKGSDIVWDQASLGGFLADPKMFVGKPVAMKPLKNADQRAALVAYMKTLK